VGADYGVGWGWGWGGGWVGDGVVVVGLRVLGGCCAVDGGLLHVRWVAGSLALHLALAHPIPRISCTTHHPPLLRPAELKQELLEISAAAAAQDGWADGEAPAAAAAAHQRNSAGAKAAARGGREGSGDEAGKQGVMPTAAQLRDAGRLDLLGVSHL